MKAYVNEQMLTCIRKNQLFPQDVQVSKTVYVTFGSYGLKLTQITSRGSKVKYLNDWKSKSAAEINEALSKTPFEKE